MCEEDNGHYGTFQWFMIYCVVFMCVFVWMFVPPSQKALSSTNLLLNPLPDLVKGAFAISRRLTFRTIISSIQKFHLNYPQWTDDLYPYSPPLFSSPLPPLLLPLLPFPLSLLFSPSLSIPFSPPFLTPALSYAPYLPSFTHTL